MCCVSAAAPSFGRPNTPPSPVSSVCVCVCVCVWEGERKRERVGISSVCVCVCVSVCWIKKKKVLQWARLVDLIQKNVIKMWRNYLWLE